MAGSDLVAIVCNNNLPARLDIVNGMRSIDHPAVLRLADSGVVTWPDGTHYAAIAYYRPLAPRFMHSPDETHPPMSEDAFSRYFLHPLVGALADFMRMGIVHGGDPADQYFLAFRQYVAAAIGRMLVGAGRAWDSRHLFETIERGMTMPLGRGPGSHADDCYAFGVMLALLMLGHNPLKGLDDRAVLKAKMDHGTFNTLIGHHRLSPSNISSFCAAF